MEFFSLSKSFNVTGARIGFLVGREDVVSAFAKLRGQIDFGMFFPIQKAAIACLNGPRDEVEAQRLKYQERRDACMVPPFDMKNAALRQERRAIRAIRLQKCNACNPRIGSI